jgi:hypothetical protein
MNSDPGLAVGETAALRREGMGAWLWGRGLEGGAVTVAMEDGGSGAWLRRGVAVVGWDHEGWPYGTCIQRHVVLGSEGGVTSEGRGLAEVTMNGWVWSRRGLESGEAWPGGQPCHGGVGLGRGQQGRGHDWVGP